MAHVCKKLALEPTRLFSGGLGGRQPDILPFLRLKIGFTLFDFADIHRNPHHPIDHMFIKLPRVAFLASNGNKPGAKPTPITIYVVLGDLLLGVSIQDCLNRCLIERQIDLTFVAAKNLVDILA